MIRNCWSLRAVPFDAIDAERAPRLAVVDRQGREEPLAVPPRAYTNPRLSPDGTRVALDVRDQEEDIWVSGTSFARC